MDSAICVLHRATVSEEEKTASSGGMMMYLSGHFDLKSPTGRTLSGQKASNMGRLTHNSRFLSNQPQTNRRIMKCDWDACSQPCFFGSFFSKIRHTQPVFLQFLQQAVFSRRDSGARWPGCQPECGRGAYLPSFTARKKKVPVSSFHWLTYSS